MKHAMGTLAELMALLLAGLDGQGCSECEEHSDCAQGERCLNGSCELSPPPCDSEPAPTCDYLVPREECLAMGGRWGDGLGTECCNCPTGDAGCPCWSQAHCQGECLGPWDGTVYPPCDESFIGSCSETITVFGCRCFVSTFEGVEAFMFGCVD